MAASQFLSIFQFCQYLQLHQVQSQFHAALIQMLDPKSQIGQLRHLAGYSSFVSQQLAEHEFS